MFLEYGDDSVAQLGGVHLACEQASQPLAKVLERGRLAAYLEQSTRYVPYDDRPGGRWRYVVPPEVAHRRSLARGSARCCDVAFETYARWLGPLQAVPAWFPQEPEDSDFVYRSSIRAKACDTLRGLLPAATRTNVGIYATGQSYESCCSGCGESAGRGAGVRGHDARRAAQGDPGVPDPGRQARPRRRVERVPGGDTRGDRGCTAEAARRRRGRGARARAGGEDGVAGLVDPEGETKVVAAAMYPHATAVAERELLEAAREMSADERAASCAPPSATGRTGATGPAARSSGRRTGSTCSATTARSATSSATGCSRSNGSG